MCQQIVICDHMGFELGEPGNQFTSGKMKNGMMEWYIIQELDINEY